MHAVLLLILLIHAIVVSTTHTIYKYITPGAAEQLPF